MKLRLVAARQGVAWVRQGFRTFGRQPLGFAALFAACLFAFIVLRSLPLVGMLAMPVLAPAGSLLFMVASRLAAGGAPPVPAAFTEMARSGRPQWATLIKLGVVYLVSAIAINFLSIAIGGGALDTLVDPMADGKPSAEAMARMADPRVQSGFLAWLGLLGLLAVPFWHAPALVHWGRQGWAKSLFFSTVAIWRNRGAFAMYGLAWAGVGLVFTMLSGLGIAILGQQLYAFIGTPLALALVTAFYASLWFTFADCFSFTDSPPEPAAP